MTIRVTTRNNDVYTYNNVDSFNVQPFKILQINMKHSTMVCFFIKKVLKIEII